MARGLCNVFVKMTGIGAEIGNPQAHIDQGRVLEPSGADCDEPCGFAATGSFAVGGAMALVNTLIGFVMYIGYERFWAGVAWGRA